MKEGGQVGEDSVKWGLDFPKAVPWGSVVLGP